MNVLLDFDGTLVEFEFPKIGREVPHAMRVVKRLKDAGHKIILNTMRCEFFDGTLEKAVIWFNSHHDWDMTLEGVTTQKVHPFWKPEKEYTDLYGLCIDDSAAQMPLIPAVMTAGKMVDWLAVEKILEENNIILKP